MFAINGQLLKDCPIQNSNLFLRVKLLGMGITLFTRLETMRSNFTIFLEVLFCHMLAYPAGNGEVIHCAGEPRLFSISRFTRLSDA